MAFEWGGYRGSTGTHVILSLEGLIGRKDDDYEGYHFEAGTIFTVNQWTNHLDPKEHEDPYTFIPDRYMNEYLYDGLQGHWGFGCGRRVCVGWNIAMRNMWIVFSRLIYCFDFIQDPVFSTSSDCLTARMPRLTR
jgi:cytochrome P450